MQLNSQNVLIKSRGKSELLLVFLRNKVCSSFNRFACFYKISISLCRLYFAFSCEINFHMNLKRSFVTMRFSIFPLCVALLIFILRISSHWTLMFALKLNFNDCRSSAKLNFQQISAMLKHQTSKSE